MLVCSKCWEIYKVKFIKKPFNGKEYWCPKLNCVGEIIEIDELILPSITVLNKRGFKTKFCCSGHLYDKPSSCYISFDDNVEIRKSLPDGFRYERKGNVIRKYIPENLSIEEKYDYILKANLDLYEWSK